MRDSGTVRQTDVRDGRWTPVSSRDERSLSRRRAVISAVGGRGGRRLISVISTAAAAAVAPGSAFKRTDGALHCTGAAWRRAQVWPRPPQIPPRSAHRPARGRRNATANATAKCPSERPAHGHRQRSQLKVRVRQKPAARRQKRPETGYQLLTPGPTAAPSHAEQGRARPSEIGFTFH